MTPGRPGCGRRRLERDPLQVFCRIRPVSEGDTCIKVLSPSVVSITAGGGKETQHIFKRVFPAECSQHKVFEHVAQPLIESLIQGRDGLLFTYGVTGSGKTYTMIGDHASAGIMPRCISLLFKALDNVQAEKFIFKPDKLNGFDIQSHVDASSDRVDAEKRKIKKRRAVAGDVYGGVFKQWSSESSLASVSDYELPNLDIINREHVYAVFITYIEIYNNGVFDLLVDDDPSQRMQPQNKIIREDYNHHMFVHGVTEVEVKTPAEALCLLNKGQKRKRMAITGLNAESSRSHSIFTIRVVQVKALNPNTRSVSIP